MKERTKPIEEASAIDSHVVVPDSLLIHRHGKKLSGYGPTGIDKVVKTVAKIIGDKRGKPLNMSNHDLRRTMGRRHHKMGTPIETISKMLGHKDTMMTLRYLGINDDDMRSAQDKCMEKYMKGLEAGKEAVSA